MENAPETFLKLTNEWKRMKQASDTNDDAMDVDEDDSRLRELQNQLVSCSNVLSELLTKTFPFTAFSLPPLDFNLPLKKGWEHLVKLYQNRKSYVNDAVRIFYDYASAQRMKSRLEPVHLQEIARTLQLQSFLEEHAETTTVMICGEIVVIDVDFGVPGPGPTVQRVHVSYANGTIHENTFIDQMLLDLLKNGYVYGFRQCLAVLADLDRLTAQHVFDYFHVLSSIILDIQLLMSAESAYPESQRIQEGMGLLSPETSLFPQLILWQRPNSAPLTCKLEFQVTTIDCGVLFLPSDVKSHFQTQKADGYTRLVASSPLIKTVYNYDGAKWEKAPFVYTLVLKPYIWITEHDVQKLRSLGVFLNEETSGSVYESEVLANVSNLKPSSRLPALKNHTWTIPLTSLNEQLGIKWQGSTHPCRRLMNVMATDLQQLFPVFQVLRMRRNMTYAIETLFTNESFQTGLTSSSSPSKVLLRFDQTSLTLENLHYQSHSQDKNIRIEISFEPNVSIQIEPSPDDLVDLTLGFLQDFDLKKLLVEDLPTLLSNCR